ncbi:tyrosine-type recombinase/integrase [Intestinicryptomonas porci]|uniref:Tyrosine-type recombinase/integrase n=1 Tax=Intestinicryptomonas porci TaxID=2926320 RepID=A0ABU4WEB9_9BACT|nr:tyrosine-type recombinase/integrase [Opitutales bacterium CLA-KB-P66]
MSLEKGFALYLSSKSHLRPDSLRDIKYLGARLLKASPKFAKSNFSDLSLEDCEKWLSSTFDTPSQFNKARAMLHALFNFAFRHEWCEKNLVSLIERKKVIEREIKPLTLAQTKRLLQIAQTEKYKSCLAPVGLLTLAGIRPREVRKLKWNDIDLDDNSITVRSICSKTGGVRHVEICPKLRGLLQKSQAEKVEVCPTNWRGRWRKIRDNSGFKGHWVQDVLRHTYASYFTKRYSDLPRLQLNMGHRDLSLLRSRYVNMQNISKTDAKEFFGG